MNKIIDFALLKRRAALDIWSTDCKRRMELRFPKIDYFSNHWSIKTLYQTPQNDWSFNEPLIEFSNKDASFCVALRCLVSELILNGELKILHKPIDSFRALAGTAAHRLFDLTILDLRKIETASLKRAQENPSSANGIYSLLSTIRSQISLLATKGVLPRLGFSVDAKIKSELRAIHSAHKVNRRAGIGEILDRKIEACNEAMNALFENDERLNPIDRVAICIITRELCAPSRINEILCSSTDDHVTVEDYANRPPGEQDINHRAHQLLLLTMKGSKGSQWSAKPALKFMIDAFHYTTSVILEHGRRSRMLVEWYQKHPDTLYLTPELEYLRNKSINRSDLAKIVFLTDNPHSGAHKCSPADYFRELNKLVFKGTNIDTHRKDGSINSRKSVDLVAWPDLQSFLLKKVHLAMENCRKVTSHNHYEGELSKMLCLFDTDEVPFLPFAIKYATINRRLKRTETCKRKNYPPSLFEKLGIVMPVRGQIKAAEIDTHDPRRWLTTMALQHTEKLSDVLINKWANRLKLFQLQNYDFRSKESKADLSCMPDVVEMTDLSNGLATAQKLEEEYGLETAIIAVHEAGISITSMNNIAKSIDNRPIARTSRGIIIVYPQRYGVCLHQHHETPCRNYSNSCVTCNNGVVVKGHIPTNDAIRERDRLLFKSIVRQLETLVHTHNRHIADDQGSLSDHIFSLLTQGLLEGTIEQLALELIRDFHAIKHNIKDKLLANRLHEAFVSDGYLNILNDPEVSSGALLKYHNPTQHAAPGLEMALDSHGGRNQVTKDEQALVSKFPEFLPRAAGLTDERHLLEVDEEVDED